MNTLPESVSEEHKEMLNDMFEWLLDPSFEFIHLNCRYIVCIQSICLCSDHLLDSILAENF